MHHRQADPEGIDSGTVGQTWPQHSTGVGVFCFNPSGSCPGFGPFVCVNLDAFSSHTSLQILPTVSCRTCTDLLLLLALVWEAAGLRPSDASPKLFAGAARCRGSAGGAEPGPLGENPAGEARGRPAAQDRARQCLGTRGASPPSRTPEGQREPPRVTPSFPFPFEFRPPAAQERPRWDAEPPPASKNAVAEDPSVSCLARVRPRGPRFLHPLMGGGVPHRPASPVRQAPHPPGRPGSGPGWGRDAGAGGKSRETP